MDKPSLADVMLAPLSWMERSKGWRRRGLAFLYLIVVVMMGVLAWRAASLWKLPDSPEPFDLARYARVEVPDSDNAMVAYREVMARFGDLDVKNYSIPGETGKSGSEWATAAPVVHRWVEAHRAALEAWLPANDRPDSLLVQPGELRLETRLDPVQSLRAYVRLALLEGSRVEQSGDLPGAWRIYLAVLRASRHAGRHGGAIQHLVGSGFVRLSQPRIDAWIEHPAQTADLLRRAMGDIDACRAMTSPASDMVRAEYFSSLAVLEDPQMWVKLGDSGPYSSAEWTNQVGGGRWARRFLRRDPERSIRVLRLITAGYLAQCDRPKSVRAKLLGSSYTMIYDHDSQTPQAVRSITPEALDAWYKDSVLNVLGPYSNNIQAYLDAEAGIFDRFRLRIAERIFEIERKRPPKTYGELLGPYLKALPDGVEPGDGIINGSNNGP